MRKLEQIKKKLETKPDPSSTFEVQRARKDPHLYLETPFHTSVLYKSELRELTGIADYSIGYLQGGSGAGSLICVVAKRKDKLPQAQGQLLAYVGLLRFFRQIKGFQADV